jgi:hypothetical protein
MDFCFIKEEIFLSNEKTSAGPYRKQAEERVFTSQMRADLNAVHDIFVLTGCSGKTAGLSATTFGLEYGGNPMTRCFMSALERSVVVGVMCLACMTPLLAQSTVQNFDATGTAYTLTNYGGNVATIVPGGPAGSFLRLTYNGVGSTLNTIGFEQTQTLPVGRVEASFDFRMNGGADGFSFALLNTANYGATGAAPSMAEEPGLTNSFGLGFDIYQNPGEVNNNHLNLYFNGAVLQTFGTPGFDLSSDQFHRASLIIDFVEEGANVTLNLTPDVLGAPGTVVTPISNFLVTGMTSYASRVGFGARTGGVSSNHDLDNINVQFSPVPAPGALLTGLIGIVPGMYALLRRRRQQ